MPVNNKPINSTRTRMPVICVIMATLNTPLQSIPHPSIPFRIFAPASVNQIQLRDKLTWFKIVVVLMINNIINNMEGF